MIEIKEYSGGKNGIPQFEDRKAMWDSLQIDLVSAKNPAIEEYASHLGKYYANGNVKYGCFKLGDSEVLDWYCSRNQLKEMLFFWKVWEKEPIKSFFKLSEIDEESNKDFEWSSPFVLGGSLAWVLDNGGPYTKPNWGGEKSKKVGEKAAQELIANDYEDSLVLVNHVAWCSFFFDVAWDYTWVVLNKKTRLLHILMATDTD